MGWIYHWRDVWEQPGGAGRGTRGRLGADQEVAALPGGQLPVRPLVLIRCDRQRKVTSWSHCHHDNP